MIKLSWVIWDWKSQRLPLRKKHLIVLSKAGKQPEAVGFYPFQMFFDLFTVYKPVTLHGHNHANVQSLFQSWWAPGCVTASWAGVLEPKQVKHTFFIICLSPDVPLLQWSNGETVFNLPSECSSLVCMSLFCSFLFIFSLSFSKIKSHINFFLLSLFPESNFL